MPENNKDIQKIEENRRTAYAGIVGEAREIFCLDFIKQKQTLLKDIKQEALMEAQADKEVISCLKGCSHCCNLYVEASIKECEAIVYYLYQNENAMSVFLSNYPQWRQKLAQYGDLFRNVEQALERIRDGEDSDDLKKAVADALLAYRLQEIPCPFLHNDECAIYEVRPYTCAVYHTTTPPEACKSLTAQKPNICKAMLPEEIADLSFYYRELQDPGISFMAMTVYEILREGYPFISRITGLERLEEETGID